ncbi:hypothetical protein MNBD_CHLOROFLEXI01-3216 [hydrothermal vent metagenome]|uniref:Uncharacterized protein n=1 Tax=hydrothermal vent metagenome TaxID=652676 RepID=A0A3B0VUK5_9ZZZZ
MTILQILIVGLFLIVVVIAGFTAVSNWRTHQEWRREATQRGWRYTTVRWKQFAKPSYRIAGTTANGIVWELHRSMHKGQLRFSWQTNDAHLPYGTLAMFPMGSKQLAPVKTEGPLYNNLEPLKQKAMPAKPPTWPDKYLIFASHNQLAAHLLLESVANVLNQYPDWPQNGSLEKLTWNPNRLFIVCLYKNEWTALDKLVALGTALVQPSP